MAQIRGRLTKRREELEECDGKILKAALAIVLVRARESKPMDNLV